MKTVCRTVYIPSFGVIYSFHVQICLFYLVRARYVPCPSFDDVMCDAVID